MQDWVYISEGGRGDFPASLKDMVVDEEGNTYVTGNYAISGNRSDWLTQKFDPDGKRLWSVTENTGAGDAVVGRKLALTPDGGVVVIGAALGAGGGDTASDYYTVKYSSADGSRLWANWYGSPGLYPDRISGVAVDSNGDVVVTGTARGAETGDDCVTIKYASADGEQLWLSRYTRSYDSIDMAVAVAVDSKDDVVVACSATLKYASADGALLWATSEEDAVGTTALAMDANGDVVVTGVVPQLDGSGHTDYMTIKFSGADGKRIWASRYNGPGNRDDEASALVVEPNGDVVVTGSTLGSTESMTLWDYATVKYAAADGVQLWERRYNAPYFGTDRANGIALADDGVVVTGSANYQGGSGSDFITLKYASVDGEPIWLSRYTSPGNSRDDASAVAVDANGDIRVAGVTDASKNEDFGVLRLSGDSGEVVWFADEGVLDGGRQFMGNTCGAMEVDASGNAYVAGHSHDGNSDNVHVRKTDGDGVLLWDIAHGSIYGRDSDPCGMVLTPNGDVAIFGYFNGESVVALYSGGDGALIWMAPYGDGLGRDYISAIAADANGDVIVTGAWGDVGGKSGVDTFKYSSVDGSPLWMSHSSDFGGAPVAIAVDSVGNVVVIGVSPWDSESRTDYVTVKYAAVDGEQLWVNRYNGTGNGEDVPVAVAVDEKGDVLVTGSSFGTDGDNWFMELVTFKYAAVDGGTIWEGHYAGADGKGAEAVGLAVDMKGSAVVVGHGYYGLHEDEILKYASLDGSQLWASRFGEVGIPSGVAAVIVATNGDVVATGSSRGGDGLSDFFTVRYDTGGVERWSHRYRGGSSDDYQDHSVALGEGPDGSLRVSGNVGFSGGYRIGVLKLNEAASLPPEIFADDFE